MISKPKTPATPYTPDLLKTKAHFEVLDGLRGIAAVAVVIYHFMEIAVPDYTESFIAHGHLAVDFFFCLSGFVIAFAYDNRINKIGARQFFLLRLIRLQPLVVIGAILGLLTFVFDPFHNLYAKYGMGKTLMMFLSSCLMVPLPMVPERYNNLFHFNPPTWSLFWEYIANIFYALLLFKLRNKVLWSVTFIAAVALCYTAYYFGNLSVGWSAETLIGGGTRVAYSFLAGMLVYRSNWIIKSSLGFLPIGLLLALTFLVPYTNELNWIIDPLIVLFYYPLLISLGAGAGSGGRLKAICKFSGEISYPLYMVHYPFIWLFLSYVEVNKPPMNQMSMIIPIATIMLLGLAYIVMVYLDIPLRKYLTERMRKSLGSYEAL